MSGKLRRLQILISAVLIAAFWLVPVSATAQGLVPVMSISGSASVFVFRNATRPVKRFVASVKPSRTREQQIESARKIKKQYDTIAKTQPRTDRAKVLEPTKLPPNAKTLPAAQGAKLFAGVGEYFLGKSDYGQAIDFFRDAVTLDPNNVSAKNGYSEALSMKGNDLLVNEKAAEAKAVFLEALNLNPKNSAAYFGLGEVFSELGDDGQAIANYEKSLENDKSLTEIYAPLGILYYQAGEIAKADDLLTKAMANSGGTAETQYFLGLVRSSQTRIDEALTAFQKATALDPKMAEAFNSAGETLVKLKRSNEAVAVFKQAVTLKPAYFDAWLGLGEANVEIKNYPEALNAYKAAAKLRNDNWEVFAGLAEAYSETGDFNQAEANYNLAALFYTRTKDFSKDTAADLYSKVGYVIGRQCELNMQVFKPCKWNTAVKSLEKAVELGQNPLDYGNLGWAYYNSARMDIDNKQPEMAKPKLELAKVNLQKALENPKIADGVLQNLGAVQVDLGDFAGAVESLKPVVEHQPDWVFSRYALGTAYFKMNDFENASKVFRALVEKEPNNVAALSSLGVSEIKLKHGKEVKKIVETLKNLSLPAALKVENEAKLAKVI